MSKSAVSKTISRNFLQSTKQVDTWKNVIEKNHKGCCAGKLCLTNLAFFSKRVHKHVSVAHLVDKVGTDLQQGFTISLTKGSQRC